MGKQLRTRPSEIYGIYDEVAAWSFDHAVQTFGNALESRLHSVTENEKNKSSADRRAQQEMQKWLNSDNPDVVTPGRFRDPMNS
jgi:TPP-dependent 2-oxoacid decarboxylase